MEKTTQRQKMSDILQEAKRREAKISFQFQEYDLDEWTVPRRIKYATIEDIVSDGSIRKIRIEYEM